MKRLIVLIVAIIAFSSVPGVDADEYLFGKWRCESPEALKGQKYTLPQWPRGLLR
jgi:hypothetical protein